MFAMADRVDEFALAIRNMEVNILNRLNEQDVKTARIEEGQKAIHQRIDSHMDQEEQQQLSVAHERTMQINGIRDDIVSLREDIGKISKAEALNTGWRMWLTRLWVSFVHFSQWLTASLIVAGAWVLLQQAGIVH